MALHSGLTGSDLHENKGVAAAADNTVAVATSGATVWKKLTASSLDASAIKNINLVALSGTLPDMSTNGSVVFVSVPQACSLASLTVSTQATTTGSAASISVYNAATATLLGTFSVSAGAAGTTTGASITGAFAAGTSIKVISAGGSTGACPLNLTLTISLT